MKSALRVAVAGLGTVGGGTLQLLARQAELLAVRAGRRIIVAAVSARDRRRDRGVDLSAVRWYEDAVAMAADPEIDAVVELIGGSDGIARRSPALGGRDRVGRSTDANPNRGRRSLSLGSSGYSLMSGRSPWWRC